jgi:hypothetical protein
LSYRDAVVMLGGDSPALGALDRALCGALSLTTGGLSDAVLSVFDAQGRIVRLGRDLLARMRGHVRGGDRVDRARRVQAAHAVLVVTAYFEALARVSLPFSVRDLRLTREEQLGIAGAEARSASLLQALLTVAPPQPTPHVPYEDMLGALRRWYVQLSAELLAFVRGLAVWESLDETAQAAAERVLEAELCDAAIARYEQLYAQLTGAVPEFAIWTTQIEHQATRAGIRRALADMELLLASLSAAQPVTDVATALSRAYRAELPRPILTQEDTPSGIRLPTLEEAYLDPDFRVRPVLRGDLPATEVWWAEVGVRSDLTRYLARARRKVVCAGQGLCLGFGEAEDGE